jgi:GntR family transcriptional regulator, transcriptional repressor for pyruvate dehydrogenase complex
LDFKSPKTLSEKIADELIHNIINGRYAPGSRLPTEREMAESFKVTRHVIREALKRLDTLGLIKIRQGSGAIVQNHLNAGGLELIDFLVMDDRENFNPNFFRDVIDFHEIVSIYTIKLAVARMTDEEFDGFKKMVVQLTEKSNKGEPGGDILFRLSVAIVRASKNGYIRLLFNNLVRSTTIFPKIFTLNDLMINELAQELSLFFNEIVNAREKRNPGMAEKKAAEIFKRNKEKLIKQFENNSKG